MRRKEKEKEKKKKRKRNLRQKGDAICGYENPSTGRDAIFALKVGYGEKGKLF